jgi:hypothetical protein
MQKLEMNTVAVGMKMDMKFLVLAIAYFPCLIVGRKSNPIIIHGACFSQGRFCFSTGPSFRPTAVYSLFNPTKTLLDKQGPYSYISATGKQVLINKEHAD